MSLSIIRSKVGILSRLVCFFQRSVTDWKHNYLSQAGIHDDLAGV